MRGYFFAFSAFLAISLSFLWGGDVWAVRSTRAPQAAHLVWDIQRVEDVHHLHEKMGDHAAVYDSGGTLHVAYGGDHLYYARCTGGSCVVATVDSSDYVGLYASLALDSQNHPHIAYYDVGLSDSCNDEKVKYAAWDGSQWHIQVVVEGCLGKYPSIAVDGDDIPHISYFDEVSDDLQMADWQGTSWHTYTPSWLPSFGYSGYPSSLTADQQGRLHLSFIAGDAGLGRVWYILKTGDVWGTLTEVDSQPGALHLAMALDVNDRPHLSYNHSNKLSYQSFNGSTWSGREEVADMDYQGWTSILVGTDGIPRLAYKVNGEVGFVSRTSGVWGTPVAIPNTSGTERMYLGHVSSNTLGLTFFSNGVLLNTTSSSPLFVWSAPSEIDRTGWVGYHIALATSQAGDLHIVYTDEDEKQLRYAHRSAGGAWHLETVLETGADLLIYATDIDLDTNGRPHIVYQEYNDNNLRSVLRYVSWSGSAWLNHGNASQASHGGCDPSLELDDANIVYIAYNDCDYINDNLVLANYDGSWHYQTVDPDEATSHASLVVNDQGYLYISYTFYDYPNSKVRFAKKEGGLNWTLQDAATSPAITDTSLGLDSAGVPRIAFVEENFSDYIVKLASWNGQQWLVESVTTTSYWSEARLAIDGQDRLHLAFECWHHPCYGVKDGSSWAITDPVDRPPADPDYSSGITSSIAIGLGSGGQPVIAYDGELDLKVAEMIEEMWVFLPMTIR